LSSFFWSLGRERLNGGDLLDRALLERHLGLSQHSYRERKQTQKQSRSAVPKQTFYEEQKKKKKKKIAKKKTTW
jgi:hypothetical protein